ncbi:MAG: very short patch repair endonuclease [Patescibacteria group bacterium]|nr:very short patch repair endonuclease [Patescibacteria group bacterium]
MTDIFSKKKRSSVMSRIRSKNTLIEKTVFKYLRKNRVYFVCHHSKIPGKPDIARPRDKKAIFIDGDFWHGYDFKQRRDKLPPYWVAKISNNIARDKKCRNELAHQGWSILRIWEHEIEKNEVVTMKKIYKFLKDTKS